MRNLAVSTAEILTGLTLLIAALALLPGNILAGGYLAGAVIAFPILSRRAGRSLATALGSLLWPLILWIEKVSPEFDRLKTAS